MEVRARWGEAWRRRWEERECRGGGGGDKEGERPRTDGSEDCGRVWLRWERPHC